MIPGWVTTAEVATLIDDRAVREQQINRASMGDNGGGCDANRQHGDQRAEHQWYLVYVESAGTRTICTIESANR